MAAFIDTTVKHIDARLSELVEEISRLEAARAALVDGGASLVGAPSAPTRPPGRPRKAAAARSSSKPATKPRAAGRTDSSA